MTQIVLPTTKHVPAHPVRFNTRQEYRDFISSFGGPITASISVPAEITAKSISCAGIHSPRLKDMPVGAHIWHAYRRAIIVSNMVIQYVDNGQLYDGSSHPNQMVGSRHDLTFAEQDAILKNNR